MGQILSKIVKELSSVGKIPKVIMKYGSLISFLLMFGSLIVMIVNFKTANNNDIYFASKSLMQTCPTLFAESIIGGLLMDYMSKMN